jgi:hypothetical protein
VKLDNDGRFATDEAIGRWFTSHRTAPDDQIFALCASAGLYGNIDADPPYPYLWFLGVEDIPGARAQMADMLAAPSAPRFVALYQVPSNCDTSGRVGRALDANYHQLAVVGGVTILERGH